MGKSGGRKKKGSNNSSPVHRTPSIPAPSSSPPRPVNGFDLDPPVFMKRAHELKEEGNRRFQAKDYVGALQHYEQALKLLPKPHPDRAVFHSNRAACLLLMRPVDHEAVAAECSLALQVQPRYPRALLRRARAFEALGRYDLSLQDVQSLLAADPAHPDALELARRLRAALSTRHEAQQDPHSRPSPAALGASAVGSPIAGLGPCLPARPAPKKPSTPPPQPNRKPPIVSDVPNGLSPKPQAFPKPIEPYVAHPEHKKSSPLAGKEVAADPVTRWRPLKLVYDHDIRLSRMPANCSFKMLREIVSQRFPSSKSVLIKYKDADGDLVTITSSSELRSAESCINGGKCSSEADKDGALQVLRLHIVEVNPDQEPPALAEEEEEDEEEDEGSNKEGHSLAHSLSTEEPSSEDNKEINKAGADELLVPVPKEKTGKEGCDHVECKELEIDDWLFEFAQLFRTQVGIDPDAHLDLHELGMELCAEALEETVTSEEAQGLFEMAAAKFQEVAALAFFNWGNVHMCAARKRIPLDEASSKEAVAAQLHVAYDWVRERYGLAGQKYEEALRIKPDFYEGLLALGQQHFETAKLQWSFALASKIDLTTWDFSTTIQLFDSAEEKMKAATEMWEKVEEQRSAELKDPIMSKRDELLKKRRKQAGGADVQEELSTEEAAEQAAVMRSQIHLFWGNMLFERSQVEFKLGLGDWKKNLDAATERFKLAGASESDISVVLKNHASNGDEKEDSEKKIENLNTEASETNAMSKNNSVSGS